MRHISVFVMVLMVGSMAATISAYASPLTAVVSDPSNHKIALETIGNLGVGLVPIDAASIPGDSNLYVGTYLATSASIRVVDPITRRFRPRRSSLSRGKEFPLLAKDSKESRSVQTSMTIPSRAIASSTRSKRRRDLAAPT
jgi:hypothetical protein